MLPAGEVKDGSRNAYIVWYNTISSVCSFKRSKIMMKKVLSLFLLLVLSVTLFSPFINATPAHFIDDSVVSGTDYRDISWYASGRFWVMYHTPNGGHFDSSIISTADEGATWSAPQGAVGWVSGTAAIIGDDGVTVHLLSHKLVPESLIYQSATCNADGTLTFLGSTTIGVAVINCSDDIAIVLDKDGYPWIISTVGEGHNLVSARSTTKINGVFTIGPEGVQGIVSVGADFVEGNIQPLADGSMYAIYVKDNTNTLLYGKKWDVVTSTWGVEETVSDTVCEGQFFSMDSDNTQVYVAYHDVATDHAFYTIRSSTGVWSASTDISSEAIFASPSIRVDPVMGGATLIWLSSSYVVKLRMLSITGSIEGIKNCQVETGASGIVSIPMSLNDNKIGILLNTASTSFDIIDDIYTSFRISNMEGSDVNGGVGDGSSNGGLDLVVVEENYYSFEMNASAPAIDQTDYMSIKFVNNGNTIQVAFNHTSGLSTVLLGSEYIILHEVEHEHYGNILSVKWDLWFKSTCLDKEDTDVLTFAERLSGLDFGWNTYGSYFDLYNLGGWVSSTSSGGYTTTTGTTTVTTTSITQTTNIFYTTSSVITPSSVTTTTVSTSTPAVATTSLTSRITTTTTTQAGVTTITVITTSLSTATTTSNTCSTLQPITTTVTYRTTSTTVYSTSTSSSTILTTTIATNTYYSGAGGNIVGGDIFDLFVYPNAMSMGKTSFRNLQNVHALFNYKVSNQVVWHDYEISAPPIEIGMDYWVGLDYVDGWSVKISLDPTSIYSADHNGGYITKNQMRTRWRVDWMFDGAIIKTEYLNNFPLTDGSVYFGWELFNINYWTNYFGPPVPVSTSFIIDVWYNKMNSSSVVGGRVTAEYYAMKDSANPWLRWATGSDWGVTLAESTEVMLFYPLKDISGNIISARDVDMSYFWVKLDSTPDTSGKYPLTKIENWSILEYTIANGEMIGVNTPTFVKTKTPDMGQFGFLNSLIASFQQSLRNMGMVFGGVVGVLGNISYDFIDTVLAYFGLNGSFRTFTSLISNLWNQLSSQIAGAISMVTSTITLIASLFGFIVFFGGNMLATAVTLIGYIKAIFDGTSSAVTGLGNIWDMLRLNDPYVVTFVMLMGIIFWLNSLDERAKGNGGKWFKLAYEEVQIFFGVTVNVALFILNLVYTYVLGTISFVWCLIPFK